MAIILFMLLFFQQQESPIARHGSIYPHPPEPQHLEPYQLNATFEVAVKHWLWTSREPARGRIRIEQKREKGGWWVSQVRDLAVDGSLTSTVQLDTTWSRLPVVLFILLDESNRQIASMETQVASKSITGKLLLK